MKFEKLTHFARGFVYAYNGIRAAIREERNFRFHLCAALYAFVAAYWAQLPAVETALIALCVAAVLALTMWRTGTLEQILSTGETVRSWLPETTQTTEPEQLGRPVQDDPAATAATAARPQVFCIRRTQMVPITAPRAERGGSSNTSAVSRAVYRSMHLSQ